MNQVLLLIAQIVLVYVSIQLGARVTDKVKGQWLPLIIGGGVLVVVGGVLVVVHPPFGALVQTLLFCAVFFAGGVVVRARQRYFNI